MKLTPLLIGIITSLAMMAGLLVLDAEKENLAPQWQYAIYGMYAAGITWTLLRYGRSDAYNGKFASAFNQGFRCFIIITLAMVVFTIVFLQLHPEYARQEAAAVAEYYMKQGDKTPEQIADLAARAKKQYPVTVVSLSIFRYLIVGALFTAAGSFLITRRD